MLAKSPSDPLHQRLQQSRCLHCCSDCYRVERTSSRAGLTPAVDHHLSRRTRFTTLRGGENSTGTMGIFAPALTDVHFRPFTANHLAKPYFHAILPCVCQAPSSPATCRAPIYASRQCLALPLSTDY